MGKLASVQLGVETIFLQEFLVIALFHDVAVPHHQNDIRFLNGG